jgi:hypothetical protein
VASCKFLDVPGATRLAHPLHPKRKRFLTLGT